MISNKNITATQASNTDMLLSAYRQFSGNHVAMADDLFVFLTAATPERECVSGNLLCVYDIRI